MIPYNYTKFIDGLTYLAKNNFIPMSRADNAVHRILRVQFMIGLFEHPLAHYSMTKYLGIQEHRDLAREAVRKTLVLLKNGKSSKQQTLLLFEHPLANYHVGTSNSFHEENIYGEDEDEDIDGEDEPDR